MINACALILFMHETADPETSPLPSPTQFRLSFLYGLSDSIEFRFAFPVTEFHSREWIEGQSGDCRRWRTSNRWPMHWCYWLLIDFSSINSLLGYDLRPMQIFSLFYTYRFFQTSSSLFPVKMGAWDQKAVLMRTIFPTFLNVHHFISPEGL